MEVVRKLIKRKLTKGVDRPCEQVLGSRTRVAQWANIWEDFGADIEAILHYKVMKFIESGSWSSKEIDIYKQAIADGLMFASECYDENRIVEEHIQQGLDLS
jgi:hypothetical protein